MEKHIDILISLIDDNKGRNIEVIDVSKQGAWDTMVIATGNSSRHIASMGEKVVEKFKEIGTLDRGAIDEKSISNWVAIDVSNEIILHLFLEEVREYYKLEELWKNEI